ncbi:MAG: class I SAM-dependent methyltransferase [Phenylobacterium sp.]|uniref:class I SAM-dependent methyltransferase n=1 Tax=Phenylobacterium sp. TaxID=1871053 RepID=UPI001A47F82A|nr:class I SAM-dependent methyltransferase [Phenylobacterium sp.]MBL8772842.1 class I SAM-dependent methyltransferase [Phenylobacterium sp.]
MVKALPYYAPASLSAAFYDRVTAADSRLAGDEALYAGLAPPGGSILELGAGTGRLTAALAARGHEVTGVDISPAMLQQGQARLAGLAPDAGRRARLVRGDMTALDLKRTFDLVICPYFTLAHVPGGAAWRNTFATAARHLAPGGRAAFHLPSLEIMRRPGPADPTKPVLDLPLDDGGRLRLFIQERRFREGINRLDQVVEYVVLDAAGRILRRSPERLTYYWTAPQPIAEAVGLALDGAPVDLGGVGEVWVFRRAMPATPAAP